MSIYILLQTYVNDVTECKKLDLSCKGMDDWHVDGRRISTSPHLIKLKNKMTH